MRSETMIERMAIGLLLALAAGLAGAASVVPHGAGLPDPTRPPAQAAAALSGAQTPAEPSEPQLQSVMLGGSPSARVAVIDGESVRVGETFHGARVTRIADSEVELMRGRERKVLRLFAPAAVGGISRVAPGAANHSKGAP